MERLTGGDLVPSGMLIGGVTDGHQRERSGPGTPSIVNVPVTDVLPQPMAAGQVPVGHPGLQQHVDSSGGRDGSVRWDMTPTGVHFKEV